MSSYCIHVIAQTSCSETGWYLAFMMPKPERGYFEEPALRLARTDEIYRAAESTPFQLKLVEDSTTNVSVVNNTKGSRMLQLRKDP